MMKETIYNGKYFQLDADITVTKMVGQGTNRFRGIFDGGGHTITVNYTGITEDYCAPSSPTVSLRQAS